MVDITPPKEGLATFFLGGVGLHWGGVTLENPIVGKDSGLLIIFQSLIGRPGLLEVPLDVFGYILDGFG